MFWLAFIILSLGSVEKSEGSEFSALSLADLVRKGATVISRLLNPKSPALHFPAFYKFKQRMTGGDGGGDGRNEFILMLLKLMGVDSRKINDFAFDGIISLLHLINQVLVKDREKTRRERRVPRDFPSLQFILGQPQVVDLLKDMQNPELVDLILKESTEKLKDVPKENVECIHLLICKTKPFVRGMQRSLRFFMKRDNLGISGEEETCGGATREGICRAGDDEDRWERASLEGRMYFFVPSLREVIEEGDTCDQLFPNCFY